MNCTRCGKENPAEIHTCTPKALLLADALERIVIIDEVGSNNPMAKDAAAELRRLHAENEQLKAVLRRVIRTYMVADDAWDHDAELERIYQREMKK
jgi:nucleoside-triphosphatase THEP1